MVKFVKCPPVTVYVTVTGQRVVLQKFDAEGGDDCEVIVRGANNQMQIHNRSELTEATHETSVLMAAVKAKHTTIARMQRDVDMIRENLKMPPVGMDLLRGERAS
jgi:hypothetical protein